ncbi:MAG TPA: aryl-sulfate sulfotransferase [Terracidiphilus sp.]|nr:aryl-sulfate sulfotransferase [Terracidiphilus sp.]
MKSRPILPLVALLGLVAALLLTGCNARLRPTEPLPKGPSPNPPAQPPPTAGQSGSVTITPQYIALAPGQTFQFTATVAGRGQTEWLVNGVQGGNAAAGTVSTTGSYTAPASIAQSENVTVTAALTSSAQQNYATAVVSIIAPAQVTCPFELANPQVAQYALYLPAPGKMDVRFGTTTNYGLDTWQVRTSSANGGNVQTYVAGMQGQTLYHMQAQVTLDNGATYNDADHTCMTDAPPTTSAVQVTTASGPTPQPGIEMWNTILPAGDSQAFATDLQGNVIWTYTYSHTAADLIQGIQLLPNGNFLMVISYLSSLTSAQSSGVINEIREIDLAGNTVSNLTMDELNQKLAAGNFRDAEGNVYQLGSFHHAVLPLPNGHLVLLATYTRSFTNLSGEAGPTSVIGDALVDVDQNFKPDWVWNTFDHLDINRRPMNFPDWTHSNGMLYSSDDHNLLLSMRHQNWIIKINFLDGTGSGNVMWRLGEGGDFKLVNATDPTDWFYAQHGMSYFTPNTTGVFRIGLMDNGNDRIFPTGQVLCLPYKPTTAQCYSTMPVLEINETNMTATMITHYVPPPSDYSFFGGNAELLSNGNMEVNFCATLRGGIVQELDPNAQEVVWQGFTPAADQFHVYRLPSLYPGVQW